MFHWENTFSCQKRSGSVHLSIYWEELLECFKKQNLKRAKRVRNWFEAVFGDSSLPLSFPSLDISVRPSRVCVLRMRICSEELIIADKKFCCWNFLTFKKSQNNLFRNLANRCVQFNTMKRAGSIVIFLGK
jgi:hypothetical protein